MFKNNSVFYALSRVFPREKGVKSRPGTNKTKQTQNTNGLGFWGGFGGPKGRESGPEARVSGPRRGRKSGPRRGRKSRPRRGRKSGPKGRESGPPAEPGLGAYPLSFPSPFFPFFYLFFTLFYFSRFRAHVDVGSSSKEPAFDLFARVGRRGASRLFFGPGKGSPLYVAKKS